jgi:ribonuclease VapC
MIAVDTSALMAIILDEPQSDACIAALAAEDTILISAGTFAEAFIVASRQGLNRDMKALMDDIEPEVFNLTQAVAQRLADVYSKWGKGMHRAGLNLGDCFAYDVARQHGCKLLYVGNDFAKTGIESVL